MWLAIGVTAVGGLLADEEALPDFAGWGTREEVTGWIASEAS